MGPAPTRRAGLGMSPAGQLSRPRRARGRRPGGPLGRSRLNRQGMIGIRRYALLSLLASIMCIVHAIQLRKQFYPIVIYLATSKLSVTILGNMGFVMALLTAQLTRQIFLGPLRAAEVDRLNEKIWFAKFRSVCGSCCRLSAA